MSCPHCRDIGYVIAGGEVTPCYDQACPALSALESMQLEAAAVLEQPRTSPGFPNLDSGLEGMLKGNQEFRKLAVPFLVKPAEPIGLRVDVEPQEVVATFGGDGPPAGLSVIEPFFREGDTFGPGT